MTQGFNDVRFPKNGITPKKIAELMVLEFAEYVDGILPQTITDNCVQCAIICVKEILDLYKREWNIDNSYWENVLIELKSMQ